MKKSTSIVSVSIIGLLLISLQGCALTSNGNQSQAIDDATAYDTIVEHMIEPGDRLVDLSSRYTGERSLWGAIAAYNNITDPRALRIGDIVAIPYALIPDDMRTDELQLATRPLTQNTESVDVASTNSAPSKPSVTPTNSLALKRETTTSPDVIVQPVVTNKTFDLNPIDQSELRHSNKASEAATVRVVGTYYPKGVYQQPASYSTLIMRVAPGTVFELEREVNDWYKVITADGVGYLRAVDGVVVMPN